MKSEFNNFVIGFKKVWADQRGKSLIKLGLYILFAIFAVATASATYNSNNEDRVDTAVDAIEKYKDSSNYNANFLIGDTTYSYSSAIKSIIKIEDISYFIINGNLVNTLNAALEIPTFEFKFWYLTPLYIFDLIKNGQESYTKTYSDKSVETSYLVPLKYFVSTYDGTVLAIENDSLLADKNVEIVTTEKEEKIVKVKIDLSTYYVLINNQITNYSVEIDYK